MFIRSIAQKILGKRIFLLLTIISGICLAYYGFSIQFNHSNIKELSLIAAMFLGSVYLSTDWRFSSIFCRWKPQKVDTIDQRVVNARLRLETLKTAIHTALNESNRFDDYAKNFIIQKTGVLVSRCQIRLEKAEKLQKNMRNIDNATVKANLANISEQFIIGTQSGLDRLENLRGRVTISKPELSFLNKEFSIRFSEYLDEQLISDKRVDKVLNNIGMEYLKE